MFVVPYSLVLTKWMTGCGERRLSRAKCEHMVCMVCNVGEGTGVCLCSNDQVKGQRNLCELTVWYCGETGEVARLSDLDFVVMGSLCIELIDLCLGGPVQVWVL